MMTTQCFRCTRYRGQLQCDAFESAIPEKILTGQHDHTAPLGKETKLFVLIPGLDEDETDLLKAFDYTKTIAEGDEKNYARVKIVLTMVHGYQLADFDEGGVLYGMSTNQLIDLALDLKAKEDAGEAATLTE